MSEHLAKSLCAIHPSRPATARCPSCRGFFCGECITEHSGKLICASCLAASASAKETRERTPIPFHALALVQSLLASGVCWAIFYFAAKFLAGMPDEFHDGTIWE